MSSDYSNLLTDNQFVSLKNSLESIGGEIISLRLSRGTGEGENFGGIIVDVDVEWTKKDSTPISNFTVKVIPRSEILLSLIPLKACYEREIYIYSEVFPEFRRFQNERKVRTVFKSYPSFYKILPAFQEMLMFQNLRKFGFRHIHYQQPLDYHHIVIVIKEYARLHALSLAIRDQKPQLFETLTKHAGNHFVDFAKEGIRTTSLHRIENGLKALNPVEDKSVYEKFSYYFKNMIPIYYKLLNEVNKYAVISHIDTGVMNLLFKYKDRTDIPTDVCILDWQQSRLASPAIDLSSFLFSVTDKTMRMSYHDLIVEYYKTLSLFLKELGSDAEKLLPFQILQNELKTYGIISLHFAILLIYAYTSSKIPNVLEDSCHSEGFSYLYELEYRSEFDKRVRDLIIDFDNFGYNFS